MSVKVAILVPAYKPDDALVKLTSDLLDLDCERIIANIILVDDGSGRNYGATFDLLSRYPQVIVIAHVANSGKGAALKTGFEYILTNLPHVHSIVTADSDGQHLAEDILAVAQAALKYSAETWILGVRTFGKRVPLRSLFGNRLTRAVVRFLTGLPLADTQTGLRAWPLEMARQSLKISVNGYDFEMACIVRLKEIGPRVSIRELPIQTVYEPGNKSSHFDPILDSIRIYLVLVRYCGTTLIALLTDIIIFIIAYPLSESLLISQLLSKSGSALVIFFTAFNLVFHSEINKYFAFTRFIFLWVLFGLFSYNLIQFLSQVWDTSTVIAKILVELMLFVAWFAIQRNFIFKRKLTILKS